MLRFRQMRCPQQFASVHASVHNHLNLERHLIDRRTYKELRSAALAEWQALAGSARSDRVTEALDLRPIVKAGNRISATLLDRDAA